MTYGYLLLLAIVWTISYHNWFVYVEQYYLHLFTIIAYHLNANIMLLRYVICNMSYVIAYDIWKSELWASLYTNA